MNVFSQHIQTILNSFNAIFPQGSDIITILAAVALLFAASEFYKQHTLFPARRILLPLTIFFFLDGLDYGAFALRNMLGPVSELLGILCDIGVGISAFVLVFTRRDSHRAEDLPKEKK